MTQNWVLRDFFSTHYTVLMVTTLFLTGTQVVHADMERALFRDYFRTKIGLI